MPAAAAVVVIVIVVGLIKQVNCHCARHEGTLRSGDIAPRIPNLGTKWTVGSFTCRTLYARRQESCCRFYRGLGVFRNFGDDKNFHCWETNPDCPLRKRSWYGLGIHLPPLIRSLHVGFVVDNVTMGQVYLRVLEFSHISVIPPTLRSRRKRRKIRE